MTDHVHDSTDTKRLRSLSDSSSPPRGAQIKGAYENEWQKFEDSQDTVPFDDTLAIDSPLTELQTEILDFETQVLDDCYFFEEVVLDSEDEGNCRTEFIRSANGNGLPDDDKFNFQKKEAESIENIRNETDRNQGCGVNNERIDEQKDSLKLLTDRHELALSGLNNVGSPEPQETSQTNALEFVDRFLSLNNGDLSPEMDVKKTVWEKTPSVSSTNGPQCLVKKIDSIRTLVKKTGIFEWTDSDKSGRVDDRSKGTDASSQFQDTRQRSLMTHQMARDYDGKESSYSFCSNSRFVKHIHKETSRTEEMGKFDEHLPEECERDTPETFEVGFNTQIAAEAMEALSNGLCNFDAHHVPLDTAEVPPQGVIMKKDNTDHISLQTSDCTDLDYALTKAKRKKRTARKYVKDIGNSSCNSRTIGRKVLYPPTEEARTVELGPKLEMMASAKRSRSLVENWFNCKNSANDKENSGRIHSGLIMQKKANGTGGKNPTVCKDYTNAPTLAKDLKLTSTIIKKSRQTKASDTLRTNGQPTALPEMIEDGIPRYRRKRSRLAASPIKVLKSKTHANLPAAARERKLNQKEQSCLELTAITGFPRWNHLKGKRGPRKGRMIQDSNNLRTPLTTNGGEEGSSKSFTNQKRQIDNGETSYYNIDTKGKEQHFHGCYSLHASEKDSRENIVEPGLATVFSHNDSGRTNKGIIPTEPDQIKALPQCGKLDDTNSVLFSNGAESNNKFEVSSNRNLKPSVSEMVTDCTTGVNITPSSSKSSAKRSVNKNLPRVRLLNELTRLGIPDSLPDFKWRDSRRRRNASQVRVLLSQHLDDNIIKQQKKIAAKLGITIASSIKDATHFVADSFARTRNMLEAIALGKPVVTHLWLESCGEASCLIDEKNYVLRDGKKEKEIGFSMPVSFARANQHPLLKGQSVFITPNTKPYEEMIASLVKAVHGQVVNRVQLSAKDQKIKDDLLILSCEEDHAICVPFLDQGAEAYSSELLLNGIVIQKLEFERHRLFKSHPKKSLTRSKRSLKTRAFEMGLR